MMSYPKHVLRYALLGSLLVLSLSCSTLPPDCDPSQAINDGLSTALQGKPKGKHPPLLCGEAGGPSYQRAYDEGYDRGVERYCSASSKENEGRARAAAGEAPDFHRESYVICSNLAAMESFYRRGYKDGLADFCAAEGAEKAGLAYGTAGRPASFPGERYRICGNEAQVMLRAAFGRGFRAGLNSFCKSPDLENQGFGDGSRGEAPQAIESRFGKCDVKDRNRAVAFYRAGYERGLAVYCRPDQLEATAREAAESTAPPDLPVKYSRCVTLYPDLSARFSAAYSAERAKIVQARCTAERGRAQAKADAGTAKDPTGAMPDFCDAAAFAEYRRGYREGWKLVKDRLCDADAAYSRGAQDARSGRPLRYQPPPLCPDEYGPRLSRSYGQGYASWQGTGWPPGALTYEASLARERCLHAGFGPASCTGVTSIACIETGHQPHDCHIASAHMVAVDACLRRGYTPFECRDVKDRECIERGQSPFQCESAP